MMFSTQGAIASRSDFDFFPSELVVVGHVPMNKKRGQRQLTRIAKAQDEPKMMMRTETQPKFERKNQDRKNTRTETQPKAERKNQDRKNTRVETQVTQPKAERKPQDRKNTRVETQPKERKTPDRQIVQRPPIKERTARITVGGSAAYVRLVELPAETLVQVAAFTGLAAVGDLAATGRAAHASLWGPESAGFWSGLGAGKGALPWDAFRLYHFKLDAGWLAELEALCLREPLEGLERACRLSKALLKTDRQAQSVLPVLERAALRAPCGPALQLLDALLPKLRSEVFPSVRGVHGARDELLERKILADIDQQQERDHEALAFDYFADELPAEPPQFWDELESLALTPCAVDWEDLPEEIEEPAPAPAIPEATSRLLAAEFLEALGARHGLAWQDTAAAMAAIER